MDILSLFVVVPIITMIGILFTKDLKGARMVSAIGMGIQLLMSFNLLFQYIAERKAGNTAEMVFTKSYVWFQSFNIHYDIGVDGIAVAMIMLTSIVVFAGIFSSWMTKELPREFSFRLFYYHQEYLVSSYH